MIHHERMTAKMEGEFVVFLIGMRLNQPWKIHKWLPVALAMPRMIKELEAHPEMGFLYARMWFSRTIFLVQYWRSKEQLFAYASDKNARHLPAWRAFNKAVGTDGSVGIWHETYVISEGNYENIYVNMPPFGLGAAGTLVTAGSDLQTASQRMNADKSGQA